MFKQMISIVPRTKKQIGFAGSLFAIMLFLPSVSFAAIAQTSSCVNANGGNSTSCTVVPTGTDVLVIATVATPTGTTMASATAGGAAMSLLTSYDSGNVKLYLYYYFGTSASTVVSVTSSGTAHVSLAVSSYSGAAAIAPEAFSASSFLGNHVTDSVTTLSANAWLVMGVGSNQAGGGGWASGTGWTLRNNNSADNEAGIGDSNAAVVTPGSVSATANYAAGSAYVADIVISIAAATSSPPGPSNSSPWPVSAFGTSSSVAASTTWAMVDNPNQDFAMGFGFFLLSFGFVINWFKTRK